MISLLMEMVTFPLIEGRRHAELCLQGDTAG